MTLGSPLRSGAGALVLLGLLVPLQSSCGAVKTARKTVKAAVAVVDCAERVAQGDESQVVPTIVQVLNASQDYALVRQDEHALVAEVREIPGLGLKLPGGGDKGYFLRFDLQSLGNTTKMLLSFFRADRNNLQRHDEPDDIISKGASTLFVSVFGALLKAGVIFLK